MMQQDRLEDRVRGVVYGQAVGDALGLGTEFMNKREVRGNYPSGLRYYSQMIRDAHRGRWPPGAWTDDTDQMLCIFDSLLEKGQVDVPDIARRIYEWAVGGGMGIGKTVRNVVYHPAFLQDPHRVSREVWENTGGKAAANGAVMRSSILGVWDYRDREAVIDNAEKVCRITHYDPRCAGSCVALCLAIRSMLLGGENPAAVTEEAEAAAVTYDGRAARYFELARSPSIEALDLDEKDSIGYTLKATGAGFWALMHAESFEGGLSAVIHEGGDADTNGAVAGSLMGARFGFAGIPPHLVQGLLGRQELETRIDELLGQS
jgi:ADP-ribosylglycohydrolase